MTENVINYGQVTNTARQWTSSLSSTGFSHTRPWTSCKREYLCPITKSLIFILFGFFSTFFLRCSLTWTFQSKLHQTSIVTWPEIRNLPIPFYFHNPWGLDGQSISRESTTTGFIYSYPLPPRSLYKLKIFEVMKYKFTHYVLLSCRKYYKNIKSLLQKWSLNGRYPLQLFLFRCIKRDGSKVRVIRNE